MLFKCRVTDLSEILMADFKLMLGKVLKVSRRYMLPFLSYRENPAGGDIRLPPPPAGRGLTWDSWRYTHHANTVG